ncbi:MAG: lactate utilization protein [Veillonellaceae bacterium]|jgi:L-lactate utilization protein LutB|nr:lactate utilization protein [Veillonellaceae bacterium]
MNQFVNWHNEILGNKVVKALEKNNFTAAYFENRADATEHILGMIPKSATVGIGGSSTVEELGLTKQLESVGNTIFNHNKPGLSPEEKLAMRRKQLTCDVFLSSTNAITLDGRLVNVDGAGNRVASMIFGPKQVIVVVGINKIVKNTAEAEQRIKLYAAPINNKRLGLSNPCTTTGECMDCQKPSRICNVTTIMHKKPFAIDIHIVIIGEDLGY